MFCLIIILLFSALYSYLYYYLFSHVSLIAVWISLGIITSVLLFAIYILLIIWLGPYSKQNNKIKHALIRPIIKFVHLILKIRIEVIGKENLVKNETYVVYANHKSMLDITALYQVFGRVSAVAKKDLLKVKILRRLMKALGVVALDRENDREGAKNLLEAIKRVKAGNNYIIFPEGGVKTRETEKMVALRAGAYKLATKANATIIPVSISGSSLISKRTPKHFVKVKIIIHKPIRYDEYKDYNTNELGLLCGTIINEGLDTLKPNQLELKNITPKEFEDKNYE